jgi:hypothetical protein
MTERCRPTRRTCRPTRRPVAASALTEAVKNRAGQPEPVLDEHDRLRHHVHHTGSHLRRKDQVRRPVMDFGNWSDYLAEYPRALLVRVTPKMAEGLWAKVAPRRGDDAGMRCRR